MLRPWWDAVCCLQQRELVVKLVPGEEFETNNRMVAATKLQDGDMVVSIQLTDGRTEAVLQTTNGVFLRFDLEEISTLKKNSKGVRGIKLGRGEELEQVYLLGTDSEQTVMYKEKQVHLNRLKIGKRDGKGVKCGFKTALAELLFTPCQKAA